MHSNDQLETITRRISRSGERLTMSMFRCLRGASASSAPTRRAYMCCAVCRSDPIRERKRYVLCPFPFLQREIREIRQKPSGGLRYVVMRTSEDGDAQTIPCPAANLDARSPANVVRKKLPKRFGRSAGVIILSACDPVLFDQIKDRIDRSRRSSRGQRRRGCDDPKESAGRTSNFLLQFLLGGKGRL